MNNQYLKKYANLLINYCIQPKKNEVILVSTTTAATPILPYLLEFALECGSHIEFDITFAQQSSIFYTHASDEQLTTLPVASKEKIQSYDASISINAPVESLNKIPNISLKKQKRSDAMRELHQLKMKRSVTDQFRWVICNYPTMQHAKSAKMTLKDYTNFLINACFLDTKDPIHSWMQLKDRQQSYVDFLNQVNELHFLNDGIDLKVGVKNRLWVNSDGRRNMPSGEVFTSPIESEVNGHVSFSYPSQYYNETIKCVDLEFKDGKVSSYSARKNEKLLDLVLSQKNANILGEIAIGTNYNITEQTFNTLFDEKIGGTFHLALGNSYPETGGLNKSIVHWDLITSMATGEILADKKCIYKNGKFLI